MSYGADRMVWVFNIDHLTGGGIVTLSQAYCLSSMY